MDAQDINIPLMIEIASSQMDPPTIGTNESYRISINASAWKIESENYFGFVRAIETLSQLVTFEAEQHQFRIKYLPILIEDFPQYAHRGIMVDTGRQFYPKKYLMELFDAMMYNKLNVFHWKLTQSESFPFELKTFPNITLAGAFA